MISQITSILTEWNIKQYNSMAYSCPPAIQLLHLQQRHNFINRNPVLFERFDH